MCILLLFEQLSGGILGDNIKEKFTPDEKVAMIKKSCTSNNIAQLCRRLGSVSNFYN